MFEFVYLLDGDCDLFNKNGPFYSQSYGSDYRTMIEHFWPQLSGILPAESNSFSLAGTAVGCLASIPTVVLRSFVSVLAPADQQGAVFALLGCSYSVASIVGSAIFNSVYAATVHSYRGSVFFVAIGMELLMLLIFRWDLVGSGISDSASYQQN